MEKIVYFDCFAGISGDMSVGAFIDAGIKFEYIEEELKKLKVDGYIVTSEKKIKNGISTACFPVLHWISGIGMSNLMPNGSPN